MLGEEPGIESLEINQISAHTCHMPHAIADLCFVISIDLVTHESAAKRATEIHQIRLFPRTKRFRQSFTIKCLTIAPNSESIPKIMLTNQFIPNYPSLSPRPKFYIRTILHTRKTIPQLILILPLSPSL